MIERMFSAASLLIFCVSAAIAAEPGAGAEIAQWGGLPCKNMVSQEKNLPASFAPGNRDANGEMDLATAKNLKWVSKIGAFSCGTPVVAGGKVFVGGMIETKGVLKCFDEATGKLLWQWTKSCRKDLKEDAMNFRHFPKQLGVCSTPAVEGDRLYFVDQNAVLFCLDTNGQPAAADASTTAGAPTPAPREAREIWSFDMYTDKQVAVRPSDAVNGSPLIDGDLLYVTTCNGVDRIITHPIEKDAARRCFAPNAPTLIVFDKRTGRLLARDTAPTAANMLHGQWSSPSMGVVDGRKMIFLGGGDGFCYAFEALDGVPKEKELVKLKTVWWFDCNPPEYREFGGRDMIAHYTLGDRRRSDSINKASDGTFVGMSEIIATPVFYKSRVYVAIGRDPDHGRGRGALYCLDAAKTGDVTKTARLWSYQGLDRTLSTVSIAAGLLYVADVAGRLHCLDAETGKLQWVYETKSRAIGSTLVADGKVYLPTEKQLHVLATGKELKPLGQINLSAPMWATPVAANGALYIATKTTLWAAISR
ncbi:MAG: PQQ-binding-like beta-propeller repeat protein [Candidatus Sumerlaeota bacterium]|nr:PQQ-binding-like beta-propeller repeat protein [Candidatus Sumerlaeota bacterium]